MTAAACASTGSKNDAPFETRSVGGITKIFSAQTYWIGPQPTESDLGELKKAGVRTIVNLRPAPELKYDERKAVESLGMQYVHIPITPASLKIADVDAFIETLASPNSGQVFVHCASNNRAGAMWAMFRNRHQAVPIDSAIAEARFVGMTAPALEAFLRANAKQ